MLHNYTAASACFVLFFNGAVAALRVMVKNSREKQMQIARVAKPSPTFFSVAGSGLHIATHVECCSIPAGFPDMPGRFPISGLTSRLYGCAHIFPDKQP